MLSLLRLVCCWRPPFSSDSYPQSPFHQSVYKLVAYDICYMTAVGDVWHHAAVLWLCSKVAIDQCTNLWHTACCMTAVGDVWHHAAVLWLCSKTDHGLKAALPRPTGMSEISVFAVVMRWGAPTNFATADREATPVLDQFPAAPGWFTSETRCTRVQHAFCFHLKE